MSIKDNALIVSLTVRKPQLSAKDEKATHDAEAANNAAGAGKYTKDLYPKALIAPIVAVESAARAYIERNTYPWGRGRGSDLLPMTKFMDFATRLGEFEPYFAGRHSVPEQLEQRDAGGAEAPRRHVRCQRLPGRVRPEGTVHVRGRVYPSH